jgi:hypothetical protein
VASDEHNQWSRTFLDPLTVTQLFKFHRHICKTPAPNLNFNQTNPVQDPSPSFFNIHLGCNLPSVYQAVSASAFGIQITYKGQGIVIKDYQSVVMICSKMTRINCCMTNHNVVVVVFELK